MKRYLVAAAAVAVFAAGCSGGSDAAATVNGTDITAEEVEGLVFDAGDGLPDDEFVQLLGIVVQWNAIADAASAEFGIETTEEEIAAEAEAVFAEQGAGLSFEEFLETQNISESGLDQYVEQLILSDEIVAELTEPLEMPTEEEAQQLLADDPAMWTEVCAAHILVGTTEEATDVLERLDSGEDFAAVATEVSIDAGSGATGGDLGCSAPAGYVAPFAEATLSAELGEVVGPVESEFGFHLIRVDSRTEATTEQLQAGLFDVLLSTAVQDWYLAAITDADVAIAEEWGTWETDPSPGIVPVAG